MKAIYNPLNPPQHKQFVLPEDFKGFHADEIDRIRQMRKNLTVRVDMSLVKDDDNLKSILRHRLKKMGFMDIRVSGNKKGQEYPAYARIARRIGIDDKLLSAYFNHNRWIWNEANPGKQMLYLTELQIHILCLFAGIKLKLDVELEPLDDIK